MAQRYSIVECTFQNGSKLYWKKKMKKKGGAGERNIFLKWNPSPFIFFRKMSTPQKFHRSTLAPPINHFLDARVADTIWRKESKLSLGIKSDTSLPNCSLKTCIALLDQINLFMKVRDNFFLYSEEFMGTKKGKESSKDSLYCSDDGPSKSIFNNLHLCLVQEMSFTQP